MAFWGIEVKPGAPYTHLSKTSKGRLHVSQATLGLGSGRNRTLVQCNVGDKYPVFLCALVPGNSESCCLDLEFEEQQDVIFSVIGPRCVHLTGYYFPTRPQLGGDDDSESFGEDIAHSESQASDHHSEDDTYEDSFINDSDEIQNDDNEDSCVRKPIKKKDRKRLRKKLQSDEPIGNAIPQEKESDDDDDDLVIGARKIKSQAEEGQNEDVAHRRNRVLIVESDGDDDLVIGARKIKSQAEEDQKKDGIEVSNDGGTIARVGIGSLLRDQQTTMGGDLKSASPYETDNKEDPKTKKRKNEHKMEVEEGIVHKKIHLTDNDLKLPSKLQLQSENGVIQPETKTKNKKKKHKTRKDNDAIDVRPLLTENGNASSDEVKGNVSDSSAAQIRTLSSGLIIEDLKDGNADGKVACRGKKVKIKYVGKLKNGPVVESNADESPYKFRLGAGKVIEGWDIGIEGMRTGGKRRLTVPPSLGYGNKGNGENIPPDSWLVYEIELISTR